MNAPIKMSILSERSAGGEQTIKLGGRIRPGIKVLTKAAKSNKHAQQIYDEGVARRLKFSEIEKQIKAETGIENAMYPKNTPYFNVAASDFGMPEIASEIIEKWGEMRLGDKEKRLYRFPIVFHSDNLFDIYPSQLKRYGGLPNYESHYGEDDVRYCRYLPPVTEEILAQQKAQRIKRSPRRTMVIRHKCEPSNCSEFLAGQCRFRGELRFYIPKIPTTGLLGMSTTSQYAAEAIWTDLERIHSMFGFIPRSNPSKPDSYIFYLTKVQEERTYFDEFGRQCVGLQWVPKLQADIDLAAVLGNTSSQLLGAIKAPVTWLKQIQHKEIVPVMEEAVHRSDEESPLEIAGDGVGSSEIESTPAAVLKQVVVSNGLEDETVRRYFESKLGIAWEGTDEMIEKAKAWLLKLLENGTECTKNLMEISLGAYDLGLDPTTYHKYLSIKFKGLTTKPEMQREVLAELSEFESRPLKAVEEYMSSVLKKSLAA